MADNLITDEQREKMLANGRLTARGVNHDPFPVVKLFTPDGSATWLLAEIDPEDQSLAFGLCDLGLGCPELGIVSLSELAAIRGQLGLPVERDLSFEARMSLSIYAAEARGVGRIRA